MTSADPLLAVADALYAVPVGEFTAHRDESAKSARDRELGRRIKSLRKPSLAAWTVNLLVRREDALVDQAFALGDSLREAAAAMDGTELRALTRQRRQLTAALTTRARALAREYDVKLTDSVAGQVEGVLNAAMLDPVAADAVRSGILVTAFGGTGVSDLDLAAVLAVPSALGVRATARAAAPAPEPVRLHVVPEDDAVRRARAEDAVAEAEEELAQAARGVEAAQAEVSRADARRLQVADGLEGLRRQLAALEEDADLAQGWLEEAELGREYAEQALAEARDRRRTAQEALAQLDR